MLCHAAVVVVGLMCVAAVVGRFAFVEEGGRWATSPLLSFPRHQDERDHDSSSIGDDDSNSIDYDDSNSLDDNNLDNDNHTKDTTHAQSANNDTACAHLRWTKLQYVHVPKAGGSTVQVSLEKWSRKQGFPLYMFNGGGLHYDCPDRVVRRRGVVLIGHRGFGFCRSLDAEEARMTFAVVLREPVSRMRSLFDYMMTSPEGDFELYRAHWLGKSFSQLVVEAERNSTKYGSGAPERYTYDRFYEFSHQQTNFLCGWECLTLSLQNSSSESVLDASLQRALVHLDRCDIVAVMERMDDMIVQFQYQTLGLVPHSVRNKFPLENKHSGKKSEVTPEAHAILSRWGRRDQVLYDVAKQRHALLTERAKRCIA